MYHVLCARPVFGVLAFSGMSPVRLLLSFISTSDEMTPSGPWLCKGSLTVGRNGCDAVLASPSTLGQLLFGGGLVKRLTWTVSAMCSRLFGRLFCRPFCGHGFRREDHTTVTVQGSSLTTINLHGRRAVAKAVTLPSTSST